MLFQLILLAPFILVTLAAFFLKSKPFLWSSITLALGLSSWATIFYFIRMNGPFYGGADIGFGMIIFFPWYATIPLALIGLFLGSRIKLKTSVILTIIFLCVWIGLSLFNNLSMELKKRERNNQAKIHCDTMPYHCAIKENRLSDLALLNSQGYDIEAKDGMGYSPLIRYIFNYEAVKILLDLGANPKSKGRNNHEVLILTLINHKPLLETAKLLIKYGANINNGYPEQGTGKIKTLLGYAISHKNITLVKFLIRHGADASIIDGYNLNACDRARIHQLKEIEELKAICSYDLPNP